MGRREKAIELKLRDLAENVATTRNNQNCASKPVDGDRQCHPTGRLLIVTQDDETGKESLKNRAEVDGVDREQIP